MMQRGSSRSLRSRSLRFSAAVAFNAITAEERLATLERIFVMSVKEGMLVATWGSSPGGTSGLLWRPMTGAASIKVSTRDLQTQLTHTLNIEACGDIKKIGIRTTLRPLD